MRLILTSHMMVTENLQKVHKICFWAFSIIFIFCFKTDLIVCELHCVWTSLCQVNFSMNLIHSQGVWLFDIWHLLTHKLILSWHLWYLLDFLTFDTSLTPPQPVTGLFLQYSTHISEEWSCQNLWWHCKYLTISASTMTVSWFTW